MSRAENKEHKNHCRHKWEDKYNATNMDKVIIVYVCRYCLEAKKVIVDL